MNNMIREKQLFKSFGKSTGKQSNQRKKYNSYKETVVNLTSYDNVFPKDLKALIMLYMKAHNIIKVTLDYQEGIVEYLEKCPKQFFVSMWLNNEITTEKFKENMQYEVEETTEDLNGFLERVVEWFNEGRFRNG